MSIDTILPAGASVVDWHVPTMAGLRRFHW